MNKLYITDLDGTLLNNEEKISLHSEQILNELLCKGLNLTVATGRSPISLATIFHNVDIRLPVIIMNGAAVYDFQREMCIFTNPISKESIECIRKAEECADLHGYYTSVSDNRFYYWGEENKTGALKRYLSKFSQNMTEKVMDWTSVENSEMLYALYMDESNKGLDIMYEILKQDSGLTVDYYKDIYRENCWCIEIMSSSATKASAARFMKQSGNYDEIIAFGNDWNDIPLFEICNEKYAVENAVMELKKIATKVIKSNLDDGVADCLKKIWETKK